MHSTQSSRAYGAQIDLLEVYAQPNSKLAEEVIRQGGKAERFTFEHGDLSTCPNDLPTATEAHLGIT